LKHRHYAQIPPAAVILSARVILARIDGSHELVVDFHLRGLNVELFA